MADVTEEQFSREDGGIVACAALQFTVPFLLAALTPKSGQIEISPETLKEMKPIEVAEDRTTVARRRRRPCPARG